MTLGSRLLKYQLFLSLKWRRLELWVLTQFSCPKCHGRFVEVSNDHLLLRKLLQNSISLASDRYGTLQILHSEPLPRAAIVSICYSQDVNRIFKIIAINARLFTASRETRGKPNLASFNLNMSHDGFRISYITEAELTTVSVG